MICEFPWNSKEFIEKAFAQGTDSKASSSTADSKRFSELACDMVCKGSSMPALNHVRKNLWFLRLLIALNMPGLSIYLKSLLNVRRNILLRVVLHMSKFICLMLAMSTVPKTLSCPTKKKMKHREHKKWIHSTLQRPTPSTRFC